MRQIFISYRRSDSQETTGRIFDALSQRLGADKVFRDIDNIGPGEVFAEAINRRLKNCDAVLVVIGPSWASVKHPTTGQRRLDDPADLVRVEVATALRMAQKRHMRVIPVLVGNATMPAAQELPEEIRPLLERNAVQVRPDPDFHADMERLLKGLGIAPARRGGRIGALLAVGATLVAAAIVGIFTYQYLAGQPTPTPPLPPGVAPWPEATGSTPDVILTGGLDAGQKDGGYVEQVPLTLMPPAPEKGGQPGAAEGTPTFALMDMEAFVAGTPVPAVQAGRILEVKQLHNVNDVNGWGMRIEVSYQLDDADGANCTVGAFFYDAAGQALADTDGLYSDGAGHVYVGQAMSPSGGYRDWTTTLAIPYTQLHLASGNHDPAFQVMLLCDDPPVWAASFMYPFSVSIP